MTCLRFVDCDFFLYVENTCLVDQQRNVKKIEQVLNKTFEMSVTGFSITNSAFILRETRPKYND